MHICNIIEIPVAPRELIFFLLRLYFPFDTANARIMFVSLGDYVIRINVYR